MEGWRTKWLYMLYGLYRQRLRFPRELTEPVHSYWEAMPAEDLRLEPVFRRILFLREAGLDSGHEVYDFLFNCLASLHTRPMPSWLFTNFNDESRTVPGAGMELSEGRLRYTFKLLLGRCLPVGMAFPADGGPLHNRPNKYEIIKKMPLLGSLTVLSNTAAPTAKPQVDTPIPPSGSLKKETTRIRGKVRGRHRYLSPCLRIPRMMDPGRCQRPAVRG